MWIFPCFHREPFQSSKAEILIKTLSKATLEKLTLQPPQLAHLVVFWAFYESIGWSRYRVKYVVGQTFDKLCKNL